MVILEEIVLFIFFIVRNSYRCQSFSDNCKLSLMMMDILISYHYQWYTIINIWLTYIHIYFYKKTFSKQQLKKKTLYFK